MPPAPDVIWPVPVPAFVTLRVCWMSTNVAVTFLAASIVRLHVVFAPLQAPPLHPAKTELAPRFAVSTTAEPNV